MTIKRTLTLTTLHGETDQAEVEDRAREHWEADTHPGKQPFAAPGPNVVAIFTDEAGARLELSPQTWEEAAVLKPGLKITLEIGA